MSRHPRDARFIASPWDQPKLVREIAIRVLAADLAEQLRRTGGGHFSVEDPEMLNYGGKVLYGDPPNVSTREKIARVEAMNCAWSIYHMLKEKGIIGEEFDKEIG